MASFCAYRHAPRWQSYLSSVVLMIPQPGEHAGAESS
jgi:hypothetical protein